MPVTFQNVNGQMVPMYQCDENGQMYPLYTGPANSYFGFDNPLVVSHTDVPFVARNGSNPYAAPMDSSD